MTEAWTIAGFKALLESRLAVAKAAKHEDALFPMDAAQAAAYHVIRRDLLQWVLEMLPGGLVDRADHSRRVTELLEANNGYQQEARDARAQAAAARQNFHTMQQAADELRKRAEAAETERDALIRERVADVIGYQP